MATYTERAAIANDATFILRVRQAMLEAAINIVNESDAAPNHTQRARLANLVVNSPDIWAQRFAIGVALNGNVGTGNSDPSEDSTNGDGALAFVVASIWDAYAGEAV